MPGLSWGLVMVDCFLRKIWEFWREEGRSELEKSFDGYGLMKKRCGVYLKMIRIKCSNDSFFRGQLEV